MADNLGVNSNPISTTNLPELLRGLAYQHIKKNLEKTDTHITFSLDEVYVVWFTFVLGNSKALVSTTLPDGKYYEVTFNRAKQEVYIDTYVKVDNVAITIGGRVDGD